MRNWVVIGVAVLVVLVAFAVPTRSQERDRIGAMIDVTSITKKLDEMTQAVTELKKQNLELTKAAQEGNKLLTIIAASVRIMQEPVQWEYNFLRYRSDKVFNKLGEQGWELVAVYDKKDQFLFRRRLLVKKGNGGEEAKD